MKSIISIIMICGIFLSGCITTWSDSVEINPEPEDDRKYYKKYMDATREDKVVVNFETRYTLSATYLSPEFRTAFAQRFEQLFAAPQPFLEEASSKAGFFVTVYSPETDGYDLTNDQLWSIQLKTNDRAHKPILVKRLDRKSRWRPFFVDVHNWSQEYLVLFDSPSISLEAKTVEDRNLELLMANSDAKVSLSW